MMITSLLSAFNQRVNHAELAKLLLRLSLGGLLFFHGWHKLMVGTAGIQGMLTAHGLPGFIGYGVLIGEVVAPVMIILGILCRPAALVIIGTMVVAWLLAAVDKTFQLDAVGAWAIESIAFYVLMSLVLLFLGGGRYSVMKNPDWR